MPNIVAHPNIKKVLHYTHMFNQILDIIFPKTERENTVDKLLHNKIQLHLVPMLHNTRADVSVTTLTKYDSVKMRKLIHSLKFYNSVTAAKILSQLLHDYLAEYLSEQRLFDTKDILLVPVPISNKRLKQRGFNQVERILRELPKLNNGYTDIINTKILKRTRHTKRQTSLARNERLKNLVGAFTVTNTNGMNNISNTHIIVLDDIVTTGATLSAIKSALEQAGYKHISLLAIARA